MSNCWIDLTDLANWKGHMTGIQRVVYNLALAYEKDEAAKFFMFDKKSGFFEVSAESILKPITVKTDTKNEIPRQKKLSKLAEINKRIVKKSAKYTYRKLPQKIQAVAKQSYIDYRNNQEPHIITDLQHPFKPGDVVVLPGASWYRASIIQNLGAIKNKVNIKIVHVIYDLIPELFPQFFGQGFGDVYIKHMFDVFSVSDHLLAISKSTKKDSESFQQKLILPKIPVSVFRLGDNPTDITEGSSPTEKIEPNNYILSVGTLEIRKNYLALYYTWKKAKQSNIELPKLVIVGQAGWLSSDVAYLIHFDPQIRDSIIVLSNVTDTELVWLYKHSMFTVYPSWYEGWGLPIAESLNYGKLCIASNTSSMPEIAGGLIEYFDPYNVPECLEKVSKYVANPAELKAKEKEILSKYKKHTWETTYKDCKSITDGLLSA